MGYLQETFDTNTIVGVPCYIYIIMGPKTLF